MKNLTVLLFFIISNTLFAQGLFFRTGKNFTTFSYKNTTPYTEKIRINGTGTSYELGYAMPLEYNDFSYLVSVTLNDYNGTGESSSNNLEWKTTYFGIQNTIDYQFYNANNFLISAQAGLNLATILSGKQVLNNSAYNLTHNKDFSGLIFQPLIGVNSKYYISKSGYFSLGCNLAKSISLNPTPEKVSFNTFQILFGAHFDLTKN